jgi:hypothetical protein
MAWFFLIAALQRNMLELQEITAERWLLNC